MHLGIHARVDQQSNRVCASFAAERVGATKEDELRRVVANIGRHRVDPRFKATRQGIQSGRQSRTTPVQPADVLRASATAEERAPTASEAGLPRFHGCPNVELLISLRSR